jgi:autotransporter-associated beta strand protein
VKIACRSLLVPALASASIAFAATVWDNDGNGGTPGDWATAVNWASDTTPATGADVLFDDTWLASDQTVNVGTGATRVVRSLQFDAPFSYTLNNGTIQFNDNGVPGFVGISVTQVNGVSASGHTINSALTLAGAATIRNTTTPALTLNGTINNGGYGLTFDGAGNTTAAGVISGSGALVKTQAGTLTLSGANTYTGATTINDGTLALAASNRIADTSNLVLGGGTLDLNTQSERVGTLSWSADSSIDFGTTGTANTLLVGNITAASGVLTINNWTSGVDFFGSLNTGIASAILDSIYFSGVGPGAVIAASTTANPGGYTGNFYQITAAAGAVSVWNGEGNNNQWDRQGGKNWDVNSTPAANAHVAFGSGPYSTVDLAGDRMVNVLTFQNGAGSFTLYNNTLTLSSASTTGLAAIMQQSASLQTISSAVSLARNTVVDITGTGDLLIDAAVTETGGARKIVKVGDGTGKLILGGTGTNTYSGGLFIDAGTVEAQKTSALGTGAATIASGATLELSGGITPTNAITLGGTGVGGNGAVRNLSGANTLSGSLTLSNDTRVQSDAGTLTLSGSLTGSGRDLNVGGAGNTVISGVIGTGAGNVTKDGAGSLTLSGANTYTGTTTIDAGSIILGASDRLSDSSNVTIGAAGTLDLAGVSERIHNLTASGDGATLDFGADSAANTFLFDTFTAPESGVLVVNNWESGLDNLATTVSGQTSIGSIYFSGIGVAAYNGTATLYGGVRYLLKPVTATEKEWNGTLDNTWNAADNWTDPTKPGTTEVARFGSFGVSRPDVVLDGDNTLAGIVFGTGASVAYSVTGTSTLTLSGTVPYIQQQSTHAQTLAMSTLRLDGNTVADITGTGNLLIDAAVTETGGARRLIRDGTGTGKLVLGGTGTSTYSGGLFINTGIVEAQKTSALGTGAATIASGAALELSGGITPTNAITLGGTGVGGNGAVRNLSGDNTLSGNLTLSNNTRVQSDAGTLTFSGGISGSGLHLNVGGTGNTVISGVIGTGAGNVTKDGAGVLTLSGANTYTGTTTISEGSVTLGAADRLADTSNLALAGGTLNINGHSEQVGNLTVSADSNIDFGTARTDNNLLFNAFTATPSGVISVYNWERGSDFFASTTALSVDELSMFYFVGYGSGASQLAAQSIAGYGSGWRPLDAALIEWYTWDSGGGTDRWDTGANWSHLTSDNKTPATNSWVAFGSGAQSAIDLRANRTVNGLRFDAGSGSFNIGNGQANTLTFSGAVASSIAFIQQNSSSNQSLTMGTVSLARNTVVDLAGTGNLTISSALTGTGNLVKENTGGKLILSGASTGYAGGIFINNGVLQITASDALGNTTGATTVAANATLELNGGAITSAENIGLSGAGFSSGGAIRSLAGTNTLSGTLTLAADSRINADAGTLTLSNTLTGSGKNLTFGGAGNTTVSGVITTGAGTVTKDGAGTLTYSGSTANTYTGTTTINAGTLVFNKTAGVNAIAGNLVVGDGTGTDTVRLDQGNQIADTASLTLNTGGVFNLNGLSETVAGLHSTASGSQVQLGAGALTIANTTASSYAGTLTGNGSLTKSGSGRLTLSGSSGSYSGTTTVNAGMVALQAATALGTGAVNVGSGGNVEIQNSITVANAFSLQGDGSGTNDGALENLSGSNTLTGNITLANNARIGSSSGTLTLGGAGTLTGTNRNLTVSGVGDTVINRNINTGSGTLTKEGGGNLTLGAASSYTGATAINAGTLGLGVANAFSSSASITVATGAVLDLNGYAQTITSLSGGGGTAGGSIEFDGATLTLAGGANSFGGDFGFSNGTIVINAGQSLTLTDSFNAGNINIVLNGGSLFLGDGLTHTFGSLTVNTGTTSIIDFGTSGATIAQFDSVNVTGAGGLSVQNWTDYVDYFLASTSPGAQGTSPTNLIVFAGYVGNDTKWLPYGGSGNGQLTPVPEPSTYGVIFLGGAVGLLGFRRQQRGRETTGAVFQ